MTSVPHDVALASGGHKSLPPSEPSELRLDAPPPPQIATPVHYPALDGGCFWSVPCSTSIALNRASAAGQGKAAMQRTKRPVPRKVPLTNLSDHPKLHWPPGVEPNPPWAGPGAEVPDPSHIVLTKVDLAEADKHAPRHLILTGTYHGNIYRTTFTAGDGELLNNLGELLRKCVGEPIYQIGARQVDRSIRPA
jgi:hypothetical protein